MNDKEVNTDLDKIRKKIKKLFALSKSPNPNEAASAMEKAQELIDQYNIEHDSILDFDITEKKTIRQGGEKPPAYESHLTSHIAAAFGCRKYQESSWKTGRLKHSWIFVGVTYKAEIAAFIADVLLRKLRASRAEYLKTLSRMRKRDSKTRRADEYCLGWVVIVIKKLNAFVSTQEEETAIELYMKRYESDLKELEITQRKPLSKYQGIDFSNGYRAGEGVEIQHGVNGKKQGSALIESA